MCFDKTTKGKQEKYNKEQITQLNEVFQRNLEMETFSHIRGQYGQQSKLHRIKRQHIT